MTRLRPVAACAAAGVVIALVVGTASPAVASVPPTISIETPTADAVLISQPTISGNVTMPGGLDSVRNVAVSLASRFGAPEPCDPCGSDNGSSVSFSWSPELSRNGPYQARVSAAGSQFLLGVFDGESTAETAVSFRMEVAPADPGDVRAEANPDQSVRVTWARNSEPDMIAYRVQRKDPDTSVFRDVGGAVPQPAKGSAVSIADPGTAQGGTFVYQVQAIRAGRSGDASTAVGSGFSSTRVQVAAPGTGGPAPGPAATPPENAAPTPNLSAFLNGSGGGLPKASVSGRPAIPDGGFEQNLPFAIPPLSKSGRAGDEAIGLQAESAANTTRAVLIPVAGGLLLCLVAFHVRRFNDLLSATPGARGAIRSRRAPDLPATLTVEPTSDLPPPPPVTPITPVTPARIPVATLLLAPAESRPKPTVARKRRSTVVPAPTGSGKSAEAFEQWLKGSASGAGAKNDQTDQADQTDDNQADDNDAKWAPLMVPPPEPTKVRGGDSPKEPEREDILVKPGTGSARRS